MKKFYLMFLALFGITSLAGLRAQNNDEYVEADFDTPLIESVEQFSSPYTEPSEGSFDALLGNGDFWHSAWSSGNVTPGLHYFQVEFEDPESLPEKVVFWFKRRGVNNDHTTEWSVRGTNEFDAAKEDCEELGYFYTPFTGNTTEEITSKPFSPSGYRFLRFYSEAQEGTDAANFNRGYFHIARFQIYPVKQVAENDIALRLLMEGFNKYYAYYGTLPMGDMPGEYSEEAVAAFEEAVLTLDQDNLTDEELDAMTVELAQQRIDAVEALYQAALATKVPFVLASGYYRIRAGMEYTNNVVIDQDEEGNDITEPQVRPKYMLTDYSGGKYLGKWGTPEDYPEASRDICTLFKITNIGDSVYDFVSAMYDVRFEEVKQSTAVEMSDTIQNLMAIDAAGTWDGTPYANIRVATQPANAYVYLHQNNHSNGAGEGSNLVGWCNTWDDALGPRASEWSFEEVDESEAQAIIEAFAPYKDRDLMLDNYKTMVADAKAKLEIAKDVQKLIEEDKPVVSDDNPITSPCSDSAEGQHIEYLWDGNTGNFWHSSWHGEYEIEAHHYFQVEIPEDMEIPTAVAKMTRRNTSNNHFTKWTVWGTNTDFAENIDSEEPMIQGSEGLEKLAEFDTPYASATETITSDVIETKGHKYLRFYIEATSASDNSKFFHMAEFQLYPGRIYQSETNQYSVMGALATNLENIIAEQADIEISELTNDQYNAMKAAYDAFIEKFTDPAALRDAIAANEGKSALVVTGTNPGFWANTSTADDLNATIAAAKAYDEAGAYTPAQSEEFIAKLEVQAEAITNAAIPVETGKWYRFRFGTEEEYETYGWPTTGNEASQDEAENITNEALFGKYITVAGFYSEGGINNVVPAEAEEVALFDKLYLDDDADIENKDFALFRFINVGDSAYIIQNKATGLYLQKPQSGDVQLSVSPSLFTQGIAGYGQNYFSAKNLANGNLNALHAARNQNVLTTWGGWGNTDGRRGSFFVEPAEDVAADYNVTEFNMAVKPGTFTTLCVPMSIKGENGMFGVSAVAETADGISLTLVPVKEAAAGRPVFIITEGEYNADDAYDEELYAFTHGTELVAEPIVAGNLRGSFYGETVGEGAIICSNNKLSVTKSTNASVAERSAYILNGEEPFANTMAEVSYTIDVNAEDGIQQTLQNVARTGDIYTIDGRYVGRGNIRTLSQKGIYVVNGTKVAVK